MATAFIGLSVQILLTSGQEVRGTISQVDPNNGNLSLSYNGTLFNLNRNQISDLQLIQQPQSQQPQPQPYQHQHHQVSQQSSQPAISSSGSSSHPHQAYNQTPADPAILSLSTSSNPQSRYNSPQPHSNHLASVPTPNFPQSQSQSSNKTNLASSSAPLSSSLPQPSSNSKSHSNANQSSNGKRATNKKVAEEKERTLKNKKSGTKHNGNQNGNQSQRTEGQSKGKSKANKNVNSEANYSNGTHQESRKQVYGNGFDEDFDFDAGLKTFDKKKVWDEIRSADQSDRSELLVSHNRINQLSSNDDDHYRHHSSSSSRQLTKDGRNGQTKLAPNENVLSPEIEGEDKDFGISSNSKDLESFTLFNGGKQRKLEETEEEEEEDEEFLEALSSPSPAAALSSSMRKSGSNSKTQGNLLFKGPSNKVSSILSSSNLESKFNPNQFNPDGLISSIELGDSTSTKALQTEILQLKEKLALFESLSSYSLNLNESLKSSNSEPGSKTYDCLLKEKNPQKEEIEFRFGLACSFNEEDLESGSRIGLNKIRYLPPSSVSERVGKEGMEILSKLPTHYGKEIGLRPENAAVFVKRLRDALQA